MDVYEGSALRAVAEAALRIAETDPTESLDLARLTNRIRTLAVDAAQERSIRKDTGYHPSG